MTSSTNSALAVTTERWRRVTPFAAVGAVCIVAGGLVSAATAAAPSEHASWAVAYLVLVGGVAQLGLGLGQGLLAPKLPSAGMATGLVVGWNLGNAAVLIGTLTEAVWLVDVGGGLLVLSLAVLVWVARGAASRQRWLLVVFRALVLLLLVSIPVGLVLAHVHP